VVRMDTPSAKSRGRSVPLRVVRQPEPAPGVAASAVAEIDHGGLRIRLRDTDPDDIPYIRERLIRSGK
jgi:hypothetical protein